MNPPVAHVDFETYSKVDLRATGSSRYAEDPTTEVNCAGWAIGDDDPRVWVPQTPLVAIEQAGLSRPCFHSTPPHELFMHLEEGGLVYAWNAEFEIPMWEEVCVKRMGWPEIPRSQWRDTAANALSLALPAGLDAAGEALGLDIVKDRRGHHLMLKLCKPRNPSKHNPRTRWEPDQVPEDFADLYEYCAQDVRAERAIHRALPIDDLPPGELAIWQMTTEMNLRGWYVDIESVHLMLDLMARHKLGALDELANLTCGAVTSGSQIAKAKEWLAGPCGFPVEDLTKDTVAELLRGDSPPEVRRFLELRQELSKSSTAKYVAIRERVCRDGTIKNGIVYHGAATGRDVGRGVQVQNIPRNPISQTQEGVEVAFRVMRSPDPLKTIPLLYGSVPEMATKMIRAHFTARPGYEMFCADFSSIENRLAVWHAGCQYGIDLFNNGLDEYRVFGSNHYGVSYEEVTDAQRNHSKGAILLCIFGGGPKAMVNQAKRHGSHMEEKTAQDTVDFYRDQYSEIRDMWYGLSKAAMKCIRKRAPQSYKRINFRLHKGFLMARLPSGRELAYYDPKVEKVMAPWGDRIWTVTHMGQQVIAGRTVRGWVRRAVSPGRWFENIVQASARDAMMFAALATIEADYDLVVRVHDELGSEREKGKGSLEEYCGIMSTPPPWLDGIATDVTGWVGKRYRKG